MKSLPTPQLSQDQIKRIRKGLIETEREILGADQYIITLRVTAYMCLALHEEFGFGASRLARLIKRTGEVSYDMAQWIHDLGDDGWLYKQLRFIGLDAFVDTIESARKEREDFYEKWEAKYQ